MNRTLERILPKVQKPARYTGGEYNAIIKKKEHVDTRYALCFPDTYEIGMSNLGCRILYGLMNEEEGLWMCVFTADYDEKLGEYYGFIQNNTADYYCADGERRADNGQKIYVERL